jgi:hypothetical protein
MLQPSLQSNPLFANSLRSWQAAWRAEKGVPLQTQPAAAETSAAARRPRRVVRPRRLPVGKEQD